METNPLDSSIPNEMITQVVTSSVQKWGNSLAVRIPKHMADHKAFQQGSTVEISETEDGLKIVLKKQKAQYTLAELLSQCKPENRHDKIDFGKAGKELI